MYEFDWIFVKAPIGTSFSMQTPRPTTTCLLYTSPSPRDGLLSIRRQRPDVYKRQVLELRVGRDVRVRLDLREGADRHVVLDADAAAHNDLSLIHISEPTRRTPIYSSAASRCV